MDFFDELKRAMQPRYLGRTVRHLPMTLSVDTLSHTPTAYHDEQYCISLKIEYLFTTGTIAGPHDYIVGMARRALLHQIFGDVERELVEIRAAQVMGNYDLANEKTKELLNDLKGEISGEGHW